MFPAMNEIDLPQGTLRYRDSGSGDTVVLLHPLLSGGEIWRDVVARLESDHRVVVPDLPLGVHTKPLDATAERSPAGVAKLVADLLAALDLRDVTLVGNDTGGLIAQLVAVHHPERLARLVLLPCDAFEVFPPALFKPLVWATRVPAGLTLYAQPLRLRFVRNLPFTFGWLSKRGIPDDMTDRWTKNFFADAAVRRDIVGFGRQAKTSVSKGVAARLGEFAKPVLVAWAAEDKFFKPELAERLAAAFPNARLEFIEDSYTFVEIDQPERVAQLIRDFVRETSAVPAA